MGTGKVGDAMRKGLGMYGLAAMETLLSQPSSLSRSQLKSACLHWTCSADVFGIDWNQKFTWYPSHAQHLSTN
jgi:hypothetical protein